MLRLHFKISVHQIILISMSKSVILQGKNENKMHLLLYSFTRERKKTHKTKTPKAKTQKNAKNEDAKITQKKTTNTHISRTKTHIFRNEDVKKNENKSAF